MTSLHHATAEEFDAYREYTINDSSPDRTTRKDFERLLPDGLKTRNQHLLSIRGAEGAQIGFLWWTVIDRTSGTEAFVLDLVIFPPFRRRGYAKEAMRRLEDHVSELGLVTISLSVSEHNIAARSLYTALNYQPVFTRMTKKCRAEPHAAANGAPRRR